MSTCHGCAQSFGFFSKEIGCPKCGFSYCKKCLRFKITDPNTKKNIVVCSRCNSLASSKMDPEEPPVITKALLKLESLENPAKPPITVYKQAARDVRLAQLKRGMSIEDQQLADRLESLRKHESSSNHVSQRKSSEQIEEEIKTRLARLKDEDPSLKASAISSLQFNKQPETDSDLIAKYSAEVQLDSQYAAGFKGVVDNIESRLSKLRGDGAVSQQVPTTSSGRSGQEPDFEGEELTEEEQIAKIIEKFKAEVELEAKSPQVPANEPSGASETLVEDVNMYSEEDEDDMDSLCRICDEKRATLKCEECDGDLFCKNCFHELHTELGEIHKATPFKK